MKIRVLLTIICIMFCAVKFTTAQTSEELKRRKAAIQREIDVLQKSLNKTSNNKKLTLKQINSLNSKIRLRQEKINTINSEIGNLDQQINKNKLAIKELQNKLEELRKKYAGMVKFAQRNQNAYNKLMFVFAAKDFNQAYMRVKYLQQFGEKRREQADKIVATQKEIQTKINILNNNVKEKSILLADQQQEKEKLSVEKDNTSKVYNKYKKEERTYINDLSQRKKQAQALNRQIQIVIRREIEIARKRAEEEARRLAVIKEAEERKAAAAGKPVSETRKTVEKVERKTDNEVLRATPEAAKLSADFQNNRGKLPWPVESGFISMGYGTHKIDQAMFNEQGVMIRTADYASVRAVFSGEVVAVAPIMGEYTIIIKHGEYFTVYNKLRSVSVSKGQKVSTRQVIGKLGAQDNGTEVEFQILKGASAMNPEGWISK